MKESQLCTEIVRSVNETPFSYAWKIPDVSGRDRQTHTFSPARGFDLVIVHKGNTALVEAKLIKAPTTVPPRKFTEYEHRSLDAIERANGIALIALGCVFEPTPIQRAKYELPAKVKELYLFPYYHLEELWESGEFSYPWIMEDKMCHKCCWSKGRWLMDMDAMFSKFPQSNKNWTLPFKPGRK